MSARIGLIAVLALAAGGAASAQDAASIQNGHRVFEHSCAPCHAAGYGVDGDKMKPGVEALTLKYKGSEPALLEHRTDLPYAALKAFVRGGTGGMPPFRPTEISNQQIADVAAYLADTARKWVAQGKPGGQ